MTSAQFRCEDFMNTTAASESASQGGMSLRRRRDAGLDQAHGIAPLVAATVDRSARSRDRKVFISYNRDSLDVVKALAEDLAEGAEPWFDQELTGGQRWWDSILARIRDCDTFVFALTPDSIESQACGRELDYALLLGKPVLPVLLSDKVDMSELPAALAQIQCVDYQVQDKRAYVSLMRALSGLPGAPPLPDPLPAAPAVPISYIVSLKERIDSEAPLEYQEQITLTLELRDRFRGGRPAEEIVPLLERLKRRDDLLAKVGREIESILAEIARREPAAAARKKAGKKEAPPPVERKEKGQGSEAPVKASEKVDRHLRLDEALDTCVKLMSRVADGETWVFEIDPQNRFTLALEASGVRAVSAKAELRDGVTGSRAKELKALGWTVKEHGFVKGATGAVALYATGGAAALALLSKTVRDFLMSFEASHSWPVPPDREALAGAAAEFALALQRAAPDVKTMIVRKA
jgi:hypothetical protein